jgi:conjugal transfer mating pair stabilization protein TraG
MVEFSMVSTGNAEFLQSIFNSVAMIFGTGDIKRAIGCCFLLGIFIISVQAIFQGVRGIAYQNIFIGMILYLCFFSIPSRIIIEDMYTGKQPVVDNVPIGVSASASIISQMTYGITDLFTTAFGDADRITQLPFASSLKYMLAITDGMSTTKMIETLQNQASFEIKPTLTEYLRECTVQKNAANGQSQQNLQTTSVSTLLSLNNESQALAVGYYNKNGTVETKTCAEVAKAINSEVFQKINSESIRKELLGMAGYGSDNLAAYDGLDSTVALTNLGLYSADAQKLMMAAMIKPMLNRATKQFYSKREALADAMITQAKHQRNIQWGAEQSMWMSVAHPIMTFFEGFIFAITPFMACLIAFGTYGLGLIGKYLQTLLWIGLWMPLMAIVNLYINMSARGEIAAKITSKCSIESICGVDTLNQILETQLGVGGMLAAATPMLALMIVTGSTFAFTSIASRLNGADHIDEKMVAPDGIKVAPAYEVKSQTTRDPTSGQLTSGAEKMLPTYSFTETDQSMIQSAKAVSDKAVTSFSRDFQRAGGMDANFMRNSAHQEVVNSNIQNAINDTGNAVVKKAYSELLEKNKGASWNLGGQIFGIGVGANGGFKLSDGHTLTSDEARQLQAAYSKGLGVSVSQLGSESVNRGASTSLRESVTNSAQAVKTADESYQNAVQKANQSSTTVQANGAQLGESFARLAEKYNSGTATAEEAQRYKTAEAVMQSANSQKELRGEINNLRSLYMSKTFGMDGQQAHVAATMEAMRRHGLTQDFGTMGNALVGLRDPGKLGSVASATAYAGKGPGVTSDQIRNSKDGSVMQIAKRTIEEEQKKMEQREGQIPDAEKTPVGQKLGEQHKEDINRIGATSENNDRIVNEVANGTGTTGAKANPDFQSSYVENQGKKGGAQGTPKLSDAAYNITEDGVGYDSPDSGKSVVLTSGSHYTFNMSDINNMGNFSLPSVNLMLNQREPHAPGQAGNGTLGERKK